MIRTIAGISLCVLGAMGADSNATLPNDWWERSSYAYDARYLEQWLYHLELAVDHGHESGNIDMEDSVITANGVLRYQHWSLEGKYTYSRAALKQYLSTSDSGTAVTTVEHEINTFLTYDVDAIFFMAIGHRFTREDKIIIYDRHLVYAGGGIYALQSKTLTWELLAAGAMDRIHFLSDLNNIGWQKALLMQQNFRYVYDTSISFELFAYYLHEAADHHDEYQYRPSLTLQVNKNIAFVPYYEMTHYEFLSLTDQFEDEEQYGISVKVSY